MYEQKTPVDPKQKNEETPEEVEGSKYQDNFFGQLGPWLFGKGGSQSCQISHNLLRLATELQLTNWSVF